jgi:hypothetical protein
VNEGYDVKLDTSVVQAWKTIIESDVFIMSRSSFSYVPALFAHGAVYYNEFNKLRKYELGMYLW